MADTKPDPAPAPPPNKKAKNLAGLLTIVCFILSFPVIASVIWLFYMRDFDCEGLLRLPRLQTGIGIALIFVFTISNAALFLRSRFPMPGVIVVMVPLILMLTAGLALVGAYDMESRKIPASPRWFRLKIDNNNNWNNIKSCIYDTGTCDDLQSRFFTLKSYDFSTSKLTSIENNSVLQLPILQRRLPQDPQKQMVETGYLPGFNGSVAHCFSSPRLPCHYVGAFLNATVCIFFF
ncbi:hypothetical protein EZV62_012254 [Acer yangbiense]|uniref:Uncharacterized protein n=1 Tax=Acer yangbiense TaxID=1000413 RepID=A0A5C7HUW2_9ROSI|nr:hypothetical protein EZV62_012254 [Acer yangbiense]